MTIFLHEMRQNTKMLVVWSVLVGAIIVVCMATFPEVKKQTDELREAFAMMGAFTSAFGLDKIDMMEPIGYYGLDCAAVLAFGGGLFAAFVGVRMLSKEEAEHTAEFLLTHPLKRSSIVAGKLAAVVAQVALFNLFCTVCAIASFALIGEELPWKTFWLFQLAQFLMHLEIACVSFGASALLKRGGAAFGLGLAALLYFLNMVANISDKWEFLRYITPYAYADPSSVIPNTAIAGEYLAFGMAYALIGVAFAFAWYSRKGIAP
ncbi:MAG: ABC transporter permease [Eggerthellaceae bacterium]|jgi:ABC-2 type transport system permease protein|nr:ABC transporter permease [Eggerthellaceae bacterium]MDR2716316.1 ABC transporter permease [Coriobacteriaceae bacterium]